jgi:putative resolvase
MSKIVKVTIKEASEQLGIHSTTLRRWEAAGLVTPERTAGGHRRYDYATLLTLAGKKIDSSDIHKTTIAYARVSSHDQKGDLVRQVQMLESFCAAKRWECEVIEDLGSGLNYEKKGLKILLKRICAGNVDRLVLAHKDRLLRFGSELVFSLCEHFGTEIVIINAKGESSFEEDLAADVLEIITVFSARLYGSRSHKNKKTMDALKSVADAL